MGERDENEKGRRRKTGKQEGKIERERRRERTRVSTRLIRIYRLGSPGAELSFVCPNACRCMRDPRIDQWSAQTLNVFTKLFFCCPGSS